MDSQLTLVDSLDPTPPEEDIILVFDDDGDVMNTTLRIRGADLPSYYVDTSKNTTTVWARDRLLATITRRTFRPDQITLPGLSPMNLGRWLKAPKLWGFPLEFCDCGRPFEWRRSRLGQLVMRELGRPDDILAWFSKRRDLGPGNHLMYAAYLTIKPEIIGMQDVIVLSCLLAEHKLRFIVAEDGNSVFDTMIVGF
ncbi:hypothetical protein EV363DRAFT_1430055 [Boletus edulis]|nr:hypothetical protein EV363DRAFT_1430055 [Boletus edulis]